MKSKAHIKGHPIHPILVSFPIAFFVGTLIMDSLSIFYHQPEFRRIALYLEVGGIVFALLAAVPGFIDFLFTVPPASSGKKRAAKHGLTNVAAVIIFFVAFLLRLREDVSFAWIMTLELTGVILLGVAGWMGGTLVYRNQIGVDVRYANAGKWNEVHVDKQSGKIAVATHDELKENQMKLVHINGLRIVVCKTENGYVAFNDRCSHRGGSLAGGALICSTVQCPWHGSQFDVRTGIVKSGPAQEKINTYNISVSDNKVFLTVD